MYLLHRNFGVKANNSVKSMSLLIRSMSSIKKLVLYGDIASPPVRFTLITASMLKVDIEFRKVDLFKGKNKTDFYKKINPLQKVPALAVNDEVICDSHAIALYFCRNSDNNHLYPDAPLLRAKIDELMYFHSGVLFPTDSAIFSAYFARKWPVEDSMLNIWYSALDYLEFKLSKHKYYFGDEVRLCDICCGTTVSSLELLVPLLERHKNLKNWLENLKSLPCFKINMQGLERLHKFIEFVRV